METRILLAIHAWSSPPLDALFWLSHQFGTVWFCVPLFVAAAAWNRRRGERAETALWLVLGLSTYFLQEGLKLLVARPRPLLWPPLVSVSSPSFPSGHALASATYCLLFARGWARRRPGGSTAAFAVAGLFALYIGFGRLYLGVHWPTDVLAGWAIAAAQTLVAIRVRERGG